LHWYVGPSNALVKFLPPPAKTSAGTSGSLVGLPNEAYVLYGAQEVPRSLKMHVDP